MGCANVKILSKKEKTGITTYTANRHLCKPSNVLRKYMRLRLKAIEEVPSEYEISVLNIDPIDT